MHAAMEQIDVAEEAVDEGRSRIVVDIFRRTDLLDIALVHQHDLIGDFERFFLIVRDENAGHMQIVMQATQPTTQFLAHFCIQRAKRLIQQQYARLDCQRARQCNTLALAARQLRWIAIGQPVELHQLQQFGDLFAYLLFRRTRGARPHAQAECNVFKHGHVLEQRVMLEHEADLAFAYMARRGIFAIEQDLAAIRLFQTGDDAQQRRLAATGRPEQCGQFTGWKLQRDIVECDKIAELLMDIPDFDTHDPCS